MENKIYPRVDGTQIELGDEIVRTSMKNESNICRCGITIGTQKTSGLCDKCYNFEYNKEYRLSHKEETIAYRKEYGSRSKPPIPIDKTTMLCSKCNIQWPLIDFQPADRTRSKSVCTACKALRFQINCPRYNATRLVKYHENPEPLRKRNRERAAKPEAKLQRRLRRIKATMAEYDQATERSLGFCENPNCGLPAECCDHEEGIDGLRGLLCHQCNTALGLLYESPTKILGLVEYLNTRTKK